MTSILGRRVLALPIFRGASAIIFAQAATSGTGYLYWLLAARMYPVAAIGQAASITSFGIVVSLLSSQAVTASLLVRLGVSQRPRALVRTSVAVSVTMSIVLALLFIGSLPLVVPQMRAIRSPLVASAVVLLCVGQGAGIVTDGCALAVAKAKLIATRNAMFGGGKLVLLAVLAPLFPHSALLTLVGSWGAMAVISTAVALWRLWGGLAGHGWDFGRAFRGFGYQTIIAICDNVPPQLLPTVGV